MELLRTEHRTIEIKYHDFYCNECDGLVGTSIEHTNGAYDFLGAYEANVFTPDGTFKYYNQCLCEICREKFPTKVAEALKAIGFTCPGGDDNPLNPSMPYPEVNGYVYFDGQDVNETSEQN